jgi:hypothetical protein
LKPQFCNFTLQYSFNFQLKGSFPEHEKIHDSFCHGNETDAYDCYVSENDTTNGMCATIYDDAGVECEGKVLLLFQKTLLSSFSDICFGLQIGVIDMRNEWNKYCFCN